MLTILSEIKTHLQCGIHKLFCYTDYFKLKSKTDSFIEGLFACFHRSYLVGEHKIKYFYELTIDNV